jgi:hypothetical protein
MKVSARLMLVAALAFAVACSTSGAQVQHGINAYQEGRLDVAMAKWKEMEARTGEMNPKGLMRYLVYRGLTHLERNEPEEARSYLRRGYRAYQRGDSRWLPPNIVERVETALKDLGD